MSFYDNLSWPHKVAHAASGQRWLAPPHLTALSEKLREVAAGRINRLMIFMPPRHGKSELVSKWFPAWYLNLFPDRRIILASYEASFAAHWGQQAQQSWQAVNDLIGHRLKLESDRAEWWKIAHRGGYMTTSGVGGAITGKGADVAIIDDPIKNAEEAYSKTKRDAVWNWYQSTLLTRLEPGGAMILMMTRWHEDDLAGRLLKQNPEAWQVVRFPAIDGEGRALWPDRFTVAQLEEIKESIGPRWWSAMYQQEPRPDDGGSIKREWFRVCPPPEGQPDRVVRAWDFAATEKTSADWTVGAKLARYGNRWHLCDIVRRRVGPGSVAALVRSVAQQDGNAVKIVIEQEPGSSGKIATSHIIGELSGFSIVRVEPRGDKLVRALPFISQAEAGHVSLAPGAWVDEFLAEAESFPLGAHDDQIDATAHAFNALSACGVQVSFAL